MTRSEMRLQLLTSVMNWRPHLDAVGVAAEADVLWDWVEKPIEPVARSLPPMRSETVTGVDPAVRVEGTMEAPDASGTSPGRRRPTPASEAVLAAIDARTGEPFTIRDLASALDMTPGAVGHHLAKLVAEGVLVAEGATNRRTWRRPGAPAVRRRDDRTGHRLDALLARLADVAAKGGPCPTNAALGSLLGLNGSHSAELLGLLEARGDIAIEHRNGNGRRVRIVATDAVTGWSSTVSQDRSEAIEKVYAAIVAASAAGAPAPSGADLAVAGGWSEVTAGLRAIERLAADGRIEIERQGQNRRRFTVTATGKVTDWNAVTAWGGRKQKEPAPCAASEPSPDTGSPVEPLIPSSPSPKTGSSDAASRETGGAGPASSSGMAEPVPASNGCADRSSSASDDTDRPAGGSPDTTTSCDSPVRPAGLPSPASVSRPSGLSFSSRPAPRLSAAEQAAIDAAVQGGKVTVVPTGATGVVAKGFKGTPMQLVPPPFPDATAWEREAAVYLQKCGASVVTNGKSRWLIDGRWSVASEELVARANKKRAARKLPPIEIPTIAVKAKRGAA